MSRSTSILGMEIKVRRDVAMTPLFAYVCPKVTCLFVCLCARTQVLVSNDAFESSAFCRAVLTPRLCVKTSVYAPIQGCPVSCLSQDIPNAI